MKHETVRNTKRTIKKQKQKQKQKQKLSSVPASDIRYDTRWQNGRTAATAARDQLNAKC
jgi:hypothetical protein